MPQLKIVFKDSRLLAEETPATKIIVQRFGYVYDNVKLAFISDWYNIGDAPLYEDQDSFIYDDVEYDSQNIYRYKPVYNARDSGYFYEKKIAPPAPTPLGQCTTTNAFQYTVIHTDSQITGYYALESTGVFRRYPMELTLEPDMSRYTNTVFVYNGKNRAWVLIKESDSINTDVIRNYDGELVELINMRGVLYYVYSDSAISLPRDSSKWRVGGYYENIQNVRESMPQISCWYLILPPTPTPTQPPPPRPSPPPLPPTPTPSASPTPPPTPTPEPTPVLVALLLEDGRPLLHETHGYLLPEQ